MLIIGTIIKKIGILKKIVILKKKKTRIFSTLKKVLKQING